MRVPAEFLTASPEQLAALVEERRLTAIQAGHIAVAQGHVLVGTAVEPKEVHKPGTPLTFHGKSFWNTIPRANGEPATGVLRVTRVPEASVATGIFGDYNTRYQRERLGAPLTDTVTPESTHGWRYDPRTGLYRQYAEEELLAALEADHFDEVVGYESIVEGDDELEELTNPAFFEPGHYLTRQDKPTLASIPILGRTVMDLDMYRYADMPAFPEPPRQLQRV
jgi:hypothetical protein